MWTVTDEGCSVPGFVWFKVSVPKSASVEEKKNIQALQVSKATTLKPDQTGVRIQTRVLIQTRSTKISIGLKKIHITPSVVKLSTKQCWVHYKKMQL